MIQYNTVIRQTYNFFVDEKKSAEAEENGHGHDREAKQRAARVRDLLQVRFGRDGSSEPAPPPDDGWLKQACADATVVLADATPVPAGAESALDSLKQIVAHVESYLLSHGSD